MKFALVLIISVTWCVLSVFVIRHHRPTPDSFRKTTLGGIYREFLQAAPTLLRPRRLLLFALGLVAIFGSFYPVVLIDGIRCGGGQALFLIGGFVALVGAVMNLILIVLSHVNFMGGSSPCKEQTVLTWLLPLSQALVALTSVMIATRLAGFRRCRSSSYTDGLIHPATRVLRRSANSRFQYSSKRLSRSAMNDGI